MRRLRSLTVLLVPDGGERTHTLHFSLTWLRVIFGAALVTALLLAGMAASWGLLASRAHQAGELEAEVAALRAENAQIAGLAEQFAEIEARYEGLRALVSPDSLQERTGVWLPSASGGARTSRVVEDQSLPGSWPLSEGGFVTQRLLEGSPEEHPGIDIAVPSGTYIRAAGAGTVLQVGEDPVYGYFVVLDHAEGYRSLYGHASLLLAEEGMEVRQGEVIGLTGSSGRSSAPHLHFEILRDGEPLDPLTMVTPP